MNNQDIIKQAVDLIVSDFPSVVGIYLFGSTDTIYENKDSDLDVAVLSDTIITPLQLWDLSQKIAVQIDRNVDLVNLREASTVLCFQILSTGKRIFCSNKKICDEFEMIAYSSYLYFNEERKEIIDDIKKRGQVYNG